MSLFSLIKTAFTTRDYYKSMNDALRSINGNYHMLHYPYHKEDKASFEQAQKNLTEHCINRFSTLENKDVLDIGCGNGIVGLYIADKHQLNSLRGIDLNTNNIKIANEQKEKQNIKNVHFSEGDAQNLAQLESNSIDIIINIESAFHYPEKELFLKEIQRVLKPQGQFVIADILTTAKGNSLLKNWKKKMKYNHWTFAKYMDAFDNVNLKLHAKDDISEKVILGFKVYKNYFNEFNNNGKANDIFLKLFFIINVKLNIRLLKKKRKYYVFHGEKLI